MSKVEKLKIEIETLPKEEFAELICWLSEKDWDTWIGRSKPILRPAIWIS
jgi:hypothetical protein